MMQHMIFISEDNSHVPVVRHCVYYVSFLINEEEILRWDFFKAKSKSDIKHVRAEKN